jgi:hypothetical protein
MLVLERVKYQLGYPEAARDALRVKVRFTKYSPSRYCSNPERACFLSAILIFAAVSTLHTTQSILTAVEQYSMGKERPLEEYLRIVGMNMTTKEITNTQWCERGYPPPGFEKYRDLYPAGRALARQGIA